MTEKINNHSAHYCGQSDIAMEMLADRLVKAKCDSQKIPWILMAFKYFNRLGAKDDIRKELDKIANYVHRAITGEWRKETPVELVKYANKESTEEVEGDNSQSPLSKMLIVPPDNYKDFISPPSLSPIEKCSEKVKEEYPDYEEGVEYPIGAILRVENNCLVEVIEMADCEICLLRETSCGDSKCTAYGRSDSRSISYIPYTEPKGNQMKVEFKHIATIRNSEYNFPMHIYLSRDGFYWVNTSRAMLRVYSLPEALSLIDQIFKGYISTLKGVESELIISSRPTMGLVSLFIEDGLRVAP